MSGVMDRAADAVAIGGLLAGRQDYRRHVAELVAGHRYVVFYGCGAILSSIVDTWNEYMEKPIDFCCDSDPAKWGHEFAGARCISPQELLVMRDECVVFVTIGTFMPVYEYLKSAGVASVNLIYKYDLITSAYLAAQDDAEIAARLAATRSLLADERSVEVFDAILERVTGRSEDPLLMPAVCDPDQYFPQGIVELTDHEAFVDVGSYDGDTVEEFVSRTGGRFDSITCFEVDRVNYGALRENVRALPGGDRIRTYNLGLWDCEQDITYSVGKSQSTVGEGQEAGHVVRLDDVLGGEPVSFIKMDIEGAEPQALQGAARTIAARQPRLAVCVYHHIRHLWEIPEMIHALVPEHRIYPRHHTNLEYETVCYAVP
jgi:FkbM family methyltransferase